MYKDILDLLKQYEIADMRNIKNNLYDIFKQRELPRGCLSVINISQHTEISYTNASHPHNIPFLTLIKICNYLNVSMEELVKPNNRKPDLTKSNKGSLIWTREKRKEFLKFVNEFGVEEAMKKYNLSMESVVKYISQFSKK